MIRSLLAPLVIAAIGLLPVTVTALDLKKPEDNLAALIKMRCSLDERENVVTWWKGTIFAQLPTKAPQAIMGFEGFNICRVEKQDDGSWRFLSRELSFYRDLKTGAILDQFDNPISGKRVDVLHVANDPVNNVFGAPGRGPSVFPWEFVGDQVLMTFNVPLTYPNPLNPIDYPEESSGETYAGSEHFMFYAPRKALESAKVKNTPLYIGWTRIGPWVPWLKLGTTPGNLLYIAQGAKLGGIGDLPEDIRALIRKDYPEYTMAPKAWSQPNETSWTYYRKKKEAAAKTAD